MKFDLSMVDVKRVSRGWNTIHCPVCGNKRAGVKEGDKGWVFNCWEGCSIEEFCNTIDIPVYAMFYDDLEPKPKLGYDVDIERHIIAQAIKAKRDGKPFVGSDRERAVLAYRRVGRA